MNKDFNMDAIMKVNWLVSINSCSSRQRLALLKSPTIAPTKWINSYFAGSVTGRYYHSPSATDFTKKFYNYVADGKLKVDTAAKYWLLKHCG